MSTGDVGLTTLMQRFAESCTSFTQAVAQSENAIDAIDFTGHIHELSFLAGRVLAQGEALTLLTSDPSWTQQGVETVREYLPSLPGTAQQASSNGHTAPDDVD